MNFKFQVSTQLTQHMFGSNAHTQQTQPVCAWINRQWQLLISQYVLEFPNGCSVPDLSRNWVITSWQLLLYSLSYTPLRGQWTADVLHNLFCQNQKTAYGEVHCLNLFWHWFEQHVVIVLHSRNHFLMHFFLKEKCKSIKPIFNSIHSDKHLFGLTGSNDTKH